MAMEKVYRAWRYEPSPTGEQHFSTCMYTREAIESSSVLHIMEETEALIDAGELLPGEGRTRDNFTPPTK
jgi:hypothetical protein